MMVSRVVDSECVILTPLSLIREENDLSFYSRIASSHVKEAEKRHRGSLNWKNRVELITAIIIFTWK
jgi:hypothetical protein